MVNYLVLILMSLVITACGKKGPLESLEPSQYPHNYPKLPDPVQLEGKSS
jgi:predicted small lipoprotein YifL